MPEPLADALAALRPLLLDPDGLVRAVAAGRRRGQQPSWQRAVLRPVDLKNGRHLQVVTEDAQGPRTSNEAYDVARAAAAYRPAGAAHACADGAESSAARLVDTLLAEPFGNWHVETTTETVQLRVTKKGDAQVHRAVAANAQHTGHDRAKPHLIDPGDPLFTVLGAGASKRRQVDAFLHMLAGVVDDAALPSDRPLRVVDLGCGNAYLTFAAYRMLAEQRPVEVVGIDLRAQARERNNALTVELGWSEHMRFEEALITDAAVGAADVVLSLHACDTATDDALAQAVRWQAPVILASPCCHHDLQRQLKAAPTPAPYGLLTRHAILRERFGDALTDALRASLLRRVGYRVDVVQFVASEYTPRNTMIKAVHTGAPARDDAVREYDELVAGWGVTPYLQTLLADALR
ncbi:MAG: class I SAM-dependent methyltransferase [Actinomycetes bacterium]